MPAKKNNNKPQIVGLLGVGFDNQDEQKRLTRCDDFLLVGGSEKTHANMQDIAIRFTESLRGRGKRLPETSLAEVIDLLNDAADK